MESPRVEVPEEVIVTHILPKLPVKSIVRFKSVCKNWNSTISSPLFAKSHLRYSSSNSRQYLVRNWLEEWYSISCDGSTLKPAVLVGDRNLFRDSPVVEVVGCCNGLMCIFLFKRGSRYALWNPATHELRTIPLLPDHEFDNPYYTGFGYVPGLDDYVIFAGRHKPCIFSLRSGYWRKAEDKAPVDRRPISTKVGVCVGDTMYWYVKGTSTTDLSNNLIIGFNFVTQEFETIPVSRKIMLVQEAVSLCVIQGCLSLFCRRFQRVGRKIVCMMRLLGVSECVSESWEKSFSLSHLVYSADFSIPGKCCVLDSGGLKLLDCTPNTDTGGFGGIEIKGYPCSSTYYFPSLISPFGTSPTASNLNA